MTILAPLLTACTLDPKNIGSPDEADASTASATSDPGATTTSGGEPTTSTSGPTVDSATEDSASVTTDPPVDTDTDTDTDGECAAPDPTTAASFKVALDAWPEQFDDNHHITNTCTIDDVGDDGVTVTTALTCDVDGIPRGAILTMAAPSGGAVDWAAGVSVTLRSVGLDDEFGDEFTFTMTRADDPAFVLADGDRHWGDNVTGIRQIGPITREIVAECSSGSETRSFELNYALIAGPNLGLWSGNRGTLAIDASHAYAIDLDHLSEDCCHGSEHSLIRRVTL